MKNISLVLTLFLNQFLNVSHAAPEYCSNFPNFEKPQAQTKTSAIYTCIDSELITTPLDQIERLIGDIEKDTMDNMAKVFEKRLQEEAFESIFETLSKYQGVYPQTGASNKEQLLSCLEDKTDIRNQSYLPGITRSYSEFKRSEDSRINKSDKEKQKSFLTLSIINSLKANALFVKNKDFHQNQENLERSKLVDLNQCKIKETQCRKATSIFESTSVCTSDREYCELTARTVYNDKKADLDKEIAPLYGMVQNTPTLFENSNDDSFFAPFETAKLVPSSFQKKILDTFPKSKVDEFNKIHATGDNKKLNKFFSDNSSLIDSLSNNQELNDQAKLAINKQADKLSKAATEICEGKGKNLHHYPGLVKRTMDDMYRNSSDEFLQHQIISSKGAYCHLLNTQPLNQNEVSLAAISGFAMLGVGVALQVIPGPGTAVGTGLLVAGGTVLSGVGVKDYLDSDNKYQQEVGLSSSGFVNYEQLLQTKRTRDTNLAWSIADTVLLPFDLQALRAVKGRTTVATRSPSSTETLLDDYQLSLGKDIKDFSDQEVKAYANLFEYIDDPADRLKILEAIKDARKSCQ